MVTHNGNRDDRRAFMTRLSKCLLIQSFGLVGAGLTQADTIRVQLTKEQFLAFEPLGMTIQIEYASGDQNRDVPSDFKFPPSLPGRRLRLIVRDDSGTIVASSPVHTGEFEQSQGGEETYQCSGMAFINPPVVCDKQDCPPLPAGRYSCRIVDRGRSIESSEANFTLQALTGREALAADLFVATYPAGIGLVVGREGDSKTTGAFRQLSDEYPDTFFGRFAATALALAQASAVTRTQGGSPNAIVWEPIARELDAAVDGLSPDHPLYGDALFELAAAHARCGHLEIARQKVTMLRQNPGWGLRCRKLLTEIDAARTKGPASE